MVETQELILPLVHLNGTSRQSLVEQRANAIDALREAGRKLAYAYPNGRDYYHEPGLLAKAEAQHERRMNTLKSLIKELEAEMLAIDRS